jgi:hypothetical protein
MIRIVLLSLALLPLAAAAEMYKWVDEKGVTHYSEQPPPDGKANKVDIKSSGPADAAPAADWRQKERDARQTKIQKDQQEENQRTGEQNAAATRKNNCLESQRQLTIAQAPRPLFQVDEKGEKVYLDDKERQRQIDGWQANVKKYCE